MKNITLSADEGLIEEARRIAAKRRTTLNAEFRDWLADYVGQGPRLIPRPESGRPRGPWPPSTPLQRWQTLAGANSPGKR